MRASKERVRRLADRVLDLDAVILVQFEDGTVTHEGRRFASMAEAREVFSDGDRYRVVSVGPFDTSLKDV